MTLDLTVFQDKQDQLLSGSPAFSTTFVIILAPIIYLNKPVFWSLKLCSFATNIISINCLLTEHASSANLSRFHNRHRTNLPHYKIR